MRSKTHGACARCGNVVHRTKEHGPSECTGCGAGVFPTRDGPVTEFTDVWVTLKQVGEGARDHRDTVFDTEKEAVIYESQNDAEWDRDRICGVRELDEVLVFGTGISGEIHGQMIVHAEAVRVSPGKDVCGYVEMKDRGDWHQLTE